MSERNPVRSQPPGDDADPGFTPSAAAASRPSWSGLLQVGLLAIPIKA